MDCLTPNQARAIAARGNVLLQAGAGAGKTRTLVRRCVNWVLEDTRNSIEDILMVTFTEAAAAEMRQRIHEELTQALLQRPDDQHAHEELAFLQVANISTLHSFCLQLVRQNFHVLGLDPQVTVLPEGEAFLLAGEVLADVLGQHYGGRAPHSAGVLNLIQIQGNGSESAIHKWVLHLHEYTQTLPDPDRWFRAQFEWFEQKEPLHWEAWLREVLPRWAGEWLAELQMVDGPDGVAQAIAALESIRAGAAFHEWHDALARIIRAGDRADRDLWPHGKVKKIRRAFDDFFGEAEFLESITRPEIAPGLEAAREQTPASSALATDWRWSREPLVALLQLTEEFHRAFLAAKRELGAVDFHDLEQFSLGLLRDARSGRPTALAEHWRARLKLVFVDEYQDINAAQDAILRVLAREGAEANRFLVGDVKQSIYRFRLADPHIFQGYVDRWRKEATAGLVIPLQENFRSHEAILQFINPLFASIMRREIGGVEFGLEANLLFGGRSDRRELTWEGELEAGITSRAQPHVELHLCFTGGAKEKSDDEEADENGPEEGPSFLGDISKMDREARMIGLRLRDLHAQQFRIWDAGSRQHRAVEWRDMVILLRSRKNKLESFAKEFGRLGIPLLAPGGSLFESLEVMDLLSVLKLLDNPLQDHETIAVLRSPIVGLSLDELAIVRLASKGQFWIALRTYHRQWRPQNSEGSTTALESWATFNKVDRFLKSFDRWRRLAREAPLSHCLEQILEETNYISFLSTQARGQQRRANVSKLLNRTRQFDQFHRRGLFRFLRLIEAEGEADIDYEPAMPDTGNSVTVMSVHQSKGLEFPVVIVADLGKPFNLIDLRGEIIFDEQYGLCSQIKPPFAGQRYPSLPYWLAQRRQRQEALGEEMRILYVALTRACNLLILAGTAARKQALEGWRGSTPVPNRRLLRARSSLDWLGPWLQHVAGRPDWFTAPTGESPLLRWHIYEEEDSRLRPEAAPAPSANAGFEGLDPAQIEAICARINWQYPFEAATRQPAKASVSALRRLILEESEPDAAPMFPRPAATSPARHPSALSAAEVGTAHHLFLQFVALQGLVSVEAMAAEAARLEAAGALSRLQREALNLTRIAAFWRSEIGQQVLGCPEAIHRELPFTARFSATELAAHLPPELSERDSSGDEAGEDDSRSRSFDPHNLRTLARLPDEFIVVQGVVDLAVVRVNEIWILDFKTDDLSESDWPAKSRGYAPQLQLYALALERIYLRPVTHAWLHFLALNRTIECRDMRSA